MCSYSEIKGTKEKDKGSRSVIPKTVKLSDLTANLSNAANIVSGFLLKDSDLIGRSVQDVIVEPARKHLIPGFSKVKNNALNAGALGVTISGAGPSLGAAGLLARPLKLVIVNCNDKFSPCMEWIHTPFLKAKPKSNIKGPV